MGQKHKNIDDLFKQGFENLEETPSFNLWGKIEKDILTPADKVFGEKLGSLEVIPPVSAWSGIESQLNDFGFDNAMKSKLNAINQTPPAAVWNNLEDKLPLSLLVKKQLNWLSKIAGALLLLFILIYSYGTITKENTPVKNSVIPTEQNESDNKNTETNEQQIFAEEKFDSDSNNDQNSSFTVENKGNSDKALVANDVSNTEKVDSNIDAIDIVSGNKENAYTVLTLDIDKIDAKTTLAYDDLVKDRAIETISPLDNVNSKDWVAAKLNAVNKRSSAALALNGDGYQFKDPSRLATESFYKKNDKDRNNDKRAGNLLLSASVQGQNSWLFGQSLLDEINNSNNFSRSGTFGHALGLGLGYQLNEKWAVQMEAIIDSKQGQNFVIKGNGEIENASIDTRYFYVPLTFKYKSKDLGAGNSLSYIFGAQYGHLKSLAVNLPENESIDLSQDEVGLIIGLDYDFNIAKNAFITVGGRAALNTDPLNALNNDSIYNTVFGLKVSVNYMVKTKKHP